MKNLILSFLLFSVLSCSNNDSTTSNVEIPITYTLIGKSSISGPAIPFQNTVITNQTQWNALLAELNAISNVSNEFTEQNIDFDNFDIVAAFRNPVVNAGSTVDITTIVENQTNRIVTVENLVDNDLTDYAQTFHIVKIAKSAKPVLFQ